MLSEIDAIADLIDMKWNFETVKGKIHHLELSLETRRFQFENISRRGWILDQGDPQEGYRKQFISMFISTNFDEFNNLFYENPSQMKSKPKTNYLGILFKKNNLLENATQLLSALLSFSRFSGIEKMKLSSQNNLLAEKHFSSLIKILKNAEDLPSSFERGKELQDLFFEDQQDQFLFKKPVVDFQGLASLVLEFNAERNY